jgi:hypothetical protein
MARINASFEWQDEIVRKDPDGKKGNLIIWGKSQVEKTIFEGADLGMTSYTYEDDPQITGEILLKYYGTSILTMF